MSRTRVCLVVLALAAGPVVGLVGACSDETIHCTEGLTLVDGKCVPPGPDAGPGGSADAGPDAVADAGPDGSAEDGSADDGGDASVVRPVFGGVTSVSPASATSLLVTWDPATDPTTPPSAMTYAVFFPTSPDAGTPSLAEAKKVVGATSLVLTGLTSGQPYYVTVHALNKAGVWDADTKVIAGTPADDSSKPQFGGASSAEPLPGCGARLTWQNPGTDDTTHAPGLRYRVYLADSPVDLAHDTPLGTSGYGATTVDVTVPSTSTPYHQFVVVAEDAAGNLSDPTPAVSSNVTLSFATTVGALVANSCAPGCHTLNTTNKLMPTFDEGYAYGSLTTLTANVCKPTNANFCALDASTCDGWQSADAGPFYLVDPGHDPNCSVVYQVLSQGKMPPTGVQPITACDDVLVHDWIAQGAHNN